MTYTQGTLPLDRIRPDKGNIRSDLGDLSELAASIRANGLLQPLLVRPCGETFVVVDGHRRHAAARLAGVDRVPVLVAPQTAARATATMLAAAMHKALDPLDQAKAFKALRTQGMSTTAIAHATGYSASTVRDRLTLLDLPSDAQRMVADKTLGVGQAVTLAKQVKARRAGVATGRAQHPHHFTASHPLAGSARSICTHDGTRNVIAGGIACGPCWEAAIRADATGQTLAPVLDTEAIERAVQGDPAPLTLAELDIVVARLTAQGMSGARIADRLRIHPRTVERSRTRQRSSA